MDETGVQTQAETLCVDIVEAVAAETGSDPLALSPPLYEVVDTEALERVVEGGTSVTVEFEYAGHMIAVDDGEVTVDPAREGIRQPATVNVARGDRR